MIDKPLTRSRPVLSLLLLLMLLADQTLSQSTESAETFPKLKLITAERLTKLPEAERSSWEKYLTLSASHSTNDRRVLAIEMDELGLKASRPAPNKSKEFELGANIDNAWLTSSATLALADTVFSYQTPSGAWSKAVDYSAGPRPKGTHWTSQSGHGWHYCGTLDNRSTTEQIRFLAHVYRANQRVEYREATLRGIQWLLDAQFPNGGWPQVYPLEPGYHEAMTLNDNAMIHALQLLLQVSAKASPFEFVDDTLQAKAEQAASHGIDCLIQAQIAIDGKRCVWCAQHDPLTLEPVAARRKEPPSLSGGESVDVVRFLMREAPDKPPTRAAIEAAVNWFSEHKITGLKSVKNSNGKSDYVTDPSSKEIFWARFYDLQTQTPIFAGADDGIIYTSFSEMAKHNKVNYNYITTRPAELITKELDRWRKRK